ncbi:VanZ family protein [Pseudoclavibacter chungangensis]|uniref:VanZ family protein n=1 Tax=Pseudoclavibacter chungangensis TaxID=587635 RepID=A0A7J5BRM5_9MICO|nr:VanZ family protein [Pseudoclavibacter chungangensis]
MTDQLVLALIAIGAGMVAGVVLFVPFVAISYRRRGTVTIGRFALWALALVYAWAIWAFTLLPLPDPVDMVCAGWNLDPFAMLGEVRDAIGRAGGRPARALVDPAVLQIVLNVFLFVPLGFFVRVLGGRGIVVAGAIGLALSVLVETTQLTGVWGLYPCAYRVFDVDDMLTNTVGALVGSLVAFVVPRHLRAGGGTTPRPSAPRPVTKPRRLLAMAVDGIGFTVFALAVTLVARVWQFFVIGDTAAEDGQVTVAVGGVAAFVVWALVALTTGRTVGDLAVRLRYVGGPLSEPVARVLRFVGGIGGFVLLTSLPEPWAALAVVWAVVLVGATLATDSGRGLAGLVTGRHVVDDREGASGLGTVSSHRVDA